MVGVMGCLFFYVWVMLDDFSLICFIVCGVYGVGVKLQVGIQIVEIFDGFEVMFDVYVFYMLEIYIVNLGGQYQENLNGDKLVNLVVIILGDYVYSIGVDFKVLLLKVNVC